MQDISQDPRKSPHIAALLQYSRARLEIDQAIKAGDWAKARDLTHQIARAA